MKIPTPHWLLAAFALALKRVQVGRSQKSLLPTGLRGVGKTVLLNRFVDEAKALGYVVAQIEAAESETLIETLAGEIRRALFELSAKAKIKTAVSKALGVLKSFTLTFGMTDLSIRLGVDPQVGVGDSGVLSSDLTALFVAVGEAAREEKTAVLVAIDELQYLSEDQLASIIVAVHRVTQLALPLLVVGTGLPQLPALAGNAKSYAERLFEFPNVAALSRAEAFEAVRLPAQNGGVDIEIAALERLFEITKGYPYFIQEWAYSVWNGATQSPITLNDVNRVEHIVLARLDESFFRVRYDRLTPREKTYLRAMAELGPGPHRSGDIASIMKVKVETLSPLRNGLIKKGMIYSPQHGDTAFTVPLFDAFMRRTIPALLSRFLY